MADQINESVLVQNPNSTEELKFALHRATEQFGRTLPEVA
jgi:hypothetical protein